MHSLGRVEGGGGARIAPPACADTTASRLSKPFPFTSVSTGAVGGQALMTQVANLFVLE
jgi:hypothetical protein